MTKKIRQKGRAMSLSMTVFFSLLVAGFLSCGDSSLSPLAGPFLNSTTGFLSSSAALAQGASDSSGQEEAKPVVPTLISDSTGIVPGGKFKLGVKLDIVPGWHTYYKEPGDSGMPTSLTWEMPAGFEAGEIIWPKPHKWVDAGIVAYGYQGSVLHATEITAPANLKVGEKVTIKVKAKWLVCKDVCLPGKAQLEITLPVLASAAKSPEAGQFEALGNGFNDPVTTLSVEKEGGGNQAAASENNNPGSTGGGGGNSAGPSGSSSNTGSSNSGSSSTGNGGSNASAFSVLDSKLSTPSTEARGSILNFLLPAFIGGLILNVMPCVLPVIAIKVLSLLEQAKEEPGRVKLLGLVFSSGIISSFMLLAATAVGLKAAGQAAGWGFQFQYPAFVVAMAAVILLMSLSLFGMFYINVQASGQIDKLARKEDMVGTFFKGVLATILSTPCTAPFLGVALGFAFSQPPWVIFVIFLTISLGMSSPYLLLTINPGWMKFLPKPGDWMDKFKQGMGFLMLGTVVWLDTYVLASEVDTNTLFWVNAWLVGLAFCAWIVANFSDLSSSMDRRLKVFATAAGCFMLFSYICIFAQPGVLTSLAPDTARTAASAGGESKTASAEEGAYGIVWQPFSIDSLNNYLAQKKTVFLDFTADWCLTCKVNEKTVIATREVSEKLKALNVVTMKADWTRQDPTITKLLSKFDRSGVPLYVIFPGAHPDQPVVFPEVITKDSVLAALDNLPK